MVVVSALDLVMTVMQKFLDTTFTADTNEMTLPNPIEKLLIPVNAC